MTTVFSRKPTLHGDLVTLRPIRAEDADALTSSALNDPEVVVSTGSVHSSSEALESFTPDELRKVYGKWSTADDRLVLAIIDNASSAIVGEVVLNELDAGNNTCAFRTLIGAAGRGRGLGTEATRLIIEYGLVELGLHRITLEVYDFNPRARRVYEKVGFKYEGTGREALLFDGERIDVHYMGILASDLRRR